MAKLPSIKAIRVRRSRYCRRPSRPMYSPISATRIAISTCSTAPSNARRPIRRRFPTGKGRSQCAHRRRLVQVGAAYLSYGQTDKAIADLKKGIAKGGLKYPEEAKLLLGIAQLRAHNARGAEGVRQGRGIQQCELCASRQALGAACRIARRLVTTCRRSTMTIKVGERMPEGKFKTMGEKGPKDLSTANCSTASAWCCSRSPVPSRPPATPSICRATSSWPISCAPRASIPSPAWPSTMCSS